MVHQGPAEMSLLRSGCGVWGCPERCGRVLQFMGFEVGGRQNCRMQAAKRAVVKLQGDRSASSAGNERSRNYREIAKTARSYYFLTRGFLHSSAVPELWKASESPAPETGGRLFREYCSGRENSLSSAANSVSSATKFNFVSSLLHTKNKAERNSLSSLLGAR